MPHHRGLDHKHFTNYSPFLSQAGVPPLPESNRFEEGPGAMVKFTPTKLHHHFPNRGVSTFCPAFWKSPVCRSHPQVRTATTTTPTSLYHTLGLMSRPKASFQPNSQKPKYDQLHPVNLSGLKGYSYRKVQTSTQWQIPCRHLAQPCVASIYISPVMGRSLPSRANHPNTTWLYLFFQEMLLQLADCCYQTPSLPEVKQPNSSSKFISLEVSRLFFLQVNLPSIVQ